MWICERDVVSDTRKIKLVEIGLWLAWIEWWELIAGCCGLAAHKPYNFVFKVYLLWCNSAHILSACCNIDRSTWYLPTSIHRRSTRHNRPETCTQPKNEWMNDAYVINRRNQFLNVCLHSGVWLNREIRAAGVRSIFAFFSAANNDPINTFVRADVLRFSAIYGRPMFRRCKISLIRFHKTNNIHTHCGVTARCFIASPIPIQISHFLGSSFQVRKTNKRTWWTSHHELPNQNWCFNRFIHLWSGFMAALVMEMTWSTFYGFGVRAQCVMMERWARSLPARIIIIVIGRADALSTAKWIWSFGVLRLSADT